MIYDLIVVGTGAMGSAVLARAAGRGLKVLGIDRYTPPHAFGSSHGQTRIIREAYYEHPDYVPLLREAYRQWAELEKYSGNKLFLQTGGLLLGNPDSVLIRGAQRSAEEHGLPYRWLDADEIRKQFPAFRITSDMAGIAEERSGILFPEACIAAFLKQARDAGAHLAFGEKVSSWQEGDSLQTVRTGKESYQCRKLLFTAGAWLNELLPEPLFPLTIERQVLYWFSPHGDPQQFQYPHFPVFLWAYQDPEILYGFPDLGAGIKVARHYGGQEVIADHIDREVSRSEVEGMLGLLQQWIPDAAGQCLSSSVCMYSNTDDRHFRIASYRGNRNVWVASICSGHGFKFASVMGRILCDLLTGNDPGFKLDLFGISEHH